MESLSLIKNVKQVFGNTKMSGKKITERIAFWIDIKDPYITYEDKYIEKCLVYP